MKAYLVVKTKDTRTIRRKWKCVFIGGSETLKLDKTKLWQILFKSNYKNISKLEMTILGEFRPLHC